MWQEWSQVVGIEGASYPVKEKDMETDHYRVV